MTTRLFVLSIAISMVLLVARPAVAQDPPSRIGPYVVDLHATMPRFPQDAQLAASRDMDLLELPGSGLGLQIGVHVYPIRWRAVTFGIGGEFATGRARNTPVAAALRPATERFTTVAPQLSFNFGTGTGWSYISGGLGRSTWAVVPQGQEGFAADSEKLKTINYGGGARWFMKTHLAFSFDVRFYAINPGTPFVLGALGSPRTTLLVIGAGISVK